MAGIYIHIPFCKKRCSYCDFYKETGIRNAELVVDIICQEIEMRKDDLLNEVIHTIYLGGGTPSAIDIRLIEKLFNTINRFFSVDLKAEITMEANPDDLTENYLKDLALLPVNRLSMGIQSFDDDELKMLNRRHSGQQAIDAVNAIRKAGIGNFSIDLIYGLPGQSMETWIDNVNRAIELNPSHVSCYSLTYEKGTKLYQWKEQRKIIPVSDERSLSMFEYLIDRMNEAGYEHYEISNFALPGMRSKHNSAYWSGEKYLGFGPSAHSYNGMERSWNVSDNDAYVAALSANTSFRTSEILDVPSAYNEYVLTTLRTMEGLNLSVLKFKFGTIYYDYFQRLAKDHIERGDLIRNRDRVHLSKKGIFTSDGIMADLFWID